MKIERKISELTFSSPKLIKIMFLHRFLQTFIDFFMTILQVILF